MDIKNEIRKIVQNVSLILLGFYQTLIIMVYFYRDNEGQIINILIKLLEPIQFLIIFLYDYLGLKITGAIVLLTCGYGNFLMIRKLLKLKLPDLLNFALYFLWGLGVLLQIILIILYFTIVLFK